jgi:TP901 family phage tail tape measure protein
MSNNMNVSVVISAMDKFTAPAKKIAQVGDVMAKKLEKTQTTLNELANKATKVESFRQLKQSVAASAAKLAQLQGEAQQAGKRMVEAKQQVAELKQALEQETSATTQNKAAQKRLTAALEKAKHAFDAAERANKRLAAQSNTAKRGVADQQQQLQRLRGELQQSGIETKNLAAHQRDLKKNIADTTAAMEREALRVERLTASTHKYESAMQKAANISFVADAVGRTGDTITGALSAPLNKAIDFETAMTGVAKTTNFSPEGLQRFNSEIKDMSKRIPIAATGLADIAASGGQLGIAEVDLNPFVETIAMMSTAFDMLPDAAADAMGKLANVYHIPIPSIGQLGDTINELSNNSPSKAREIVDALQRIGGTAQSFGLSSDQAAALTSTLIALGKPPEVAGTAINSMLQKIQTADSQGKKFQTTLAGIGINASDLAAAVENDAQGALQGLLGKLGELDSKQRAGVLVGLFGTEFSDDVGTLVGSLGLYKKQLLIATNDAAKARSMEREFQTQASTTANKIKLMQHRWDALQIKLGNKLIPVLERMMPVIEAVVDGVDRFTTNFPTATTVILTTVATVGGIAVVVAPVLTAIAALIGAIAFLGAASRKASIELAARGMAGKAGGMASKVGGIATKAGGVVAGAATAMGPAGWIGLAGAAGAAGAYHYSKNNLDWGSKLYDAIHGDPLANQKPIVHAVKRVKPMAAAPVNTTTNNQNTYHISLNATSGHDGAQLVDEMEREIKRRDDARGRGLMVNRESDL